MIAGGTTTERPPAPAAAGSTAAEAGDGPATHRPAHTAGGLAAAAARPPAADTGSVAPATSRAPEVYGRLVDRETRCAHYRGPLDVVAIRFPCCGKYYACHDCHLELETHPPARWPRSTFETPAVFCGACRALLTIREYLTSDHRCPYCGHGFNPGCAHHHDRYFEV